MSPRTRAGSERRELLRRPSGAVGSLAPGLPPLLCLVRRRGQMRRAGAVPSGGLCASGVCSVFLSGSQSRDSFPISAGSVRQELTGRKVAKTSRKRGRSSYRWERLGGELEASWTAGIPTLHSVFGQKVRGKSHLTALKRRVWIEFGNLIRV